MSVKKIVFGLFVAVLAVLAFSCNMGMDEMQAYTSQAARRRSYSSGGDVMIGGGTVEDDVFADDTSIETSEETITNADGSTTTIKTTVKTVKNPDGSTSVVTTKTEIKTNKDGSRDVTTTITETKTPGDFNPFYNADPANNWNDPDYRFPASVVDDFFLKVVFGSGNIPDYTFYRGTGFATGTYPVTNTPEGGSPSTSNVNTKYYRPANGENRVTDPLNVNIENAEFHRFDGRNPLRRPASKAEQVNTGRFRFWHFKGKASVQNLDQYLCVVDTYSKFIWAYVKITGTSETAGQAVPVKFDAMENYGDRRMFWEYDPIGYVDSNGNVTLYDEYKNDMKNQTAVKFFPQIHNATRGVATQNGSGGAGRSPYYWASVPDWFKKGEETTTEKVIGPIHYAPGQEIDDSALGGGGDDETPVESKFLNALTAAGGYFKDRPIIPYSYKARDGSSRNATGYDTKLIEWELPFEKPQLVYSFIDEKIGESSKKTEIYKFVKDNDENGTSATFKDSTGREVVFKLDGKSLLKDDKKVGATDFADPGADFILRVSGQTYQKEVDGKLVSYRFSYDGGSVTTRNMTGLGVGGNYRGDGTYYFVQEVAGNKQRAIYQYFGQVSAIYTDPYYGLELLDGYKQIQRTRASSDLNAWSENLGNVGVAWEWLLSQLTSSSEIGIRTTNPKPDQKAVSVTITAKSIKNENMLSKYISGGSWFKDIKADTAYMMNVMRGAVYSSGQTIERKSIAKTTTSNGEYEEYGGVTAIGSGYKLNAGSTENYNKTEDFDPVVITDDGDVFIELDAKVWLYDIRWGAINTFIETAGEPYKLASFESPIIKFKYDKATKTIKLINSGSGVPEDRNWSVAEGDTKDFVINYETGVDKKFNTTDGTDKAKCKVTYSIKFTID